MAQIAVRGPDGRFVRRDSKVLTAEAEQAEGDTMSDTQVLDSISDTDVAEVEFVDELPGIRRGREAGVWTKRLSKLSEQPGRWAKVYGPTENHHTMANSLRSGSAAGIDPEDYEFAGRTLPTGPDGSGEGYVFARLLTDEQKEERDRKRAEREAAKAEQEAAAAESNGEATEASEVV